jgi:para-aminobenzoate synthetase component 1
MEGSILPLQNPLQVLMCQSDHRVDPIRLLDVMAEQSGDLALLHSGGEGNVILAVRPVAGVIMEQTGGAVACRCHGYAADIQGRTCEFIQLDQIWRRWQEILNGVTLSQPMPNLTGWLGWISYDAGVLAELPELYQSQRADIPLAHWQLFERYFVFNPASGHWQLVAVAPTAAAAEDVTAEMKHTLENLMSTTSSASRAVARSAPGGQWLAEGDEGAFKAAVRRCQQYIAAGDIYQANISSSWSCRTAASGVGIFIRLLTCNPARYAALIRYGEHEIISMSPELFLQRQGVRLETRPIKGTRPRRRDDALADEQLRMQLLESAKDRAELAMIVDLLRNDLGRVCAAVQVSQWRVMECLPGVWHTHGRILGNLANGAAIDWAGIVTAMCPGGSITGVPKIRAMEIIQELETRRRGIYCGHIGWIHPSGDGTLNIAIRTIHLTGGVASFRSGAGITAESDPDAEYAEILVKAAALRQVLDQPVEPQASPG